MRCFICNAVINDPHWDSDHKDFAPCGTCQAEINELLAQYGMEDSAEETEIEE